MPLIKFHANLRKITGMNEIAIQGASIRAVLERLVKEFPELQRYLLEDGQLCPHVLLVLNGQALDLENDLGTPVSGQDALAIFPPIAGG